VKKPVEEEIAAWLAAPAQQWERAAAADSSHEHSPSATAG
jgi:hypothetical protein